MKIGVLGTGDVGHVLAAGLAGRGHDVMIGTRDPDAAKITDWLAGQGKGVTAATFAEAAAFGELLILAIGWLPVIDLGGIENSRYLEPLAMVWIVHFFNNGFNGNHAFRLLRK